MSTKNHLRAALLTAVLALALCGATLAQADLRARFVHADESLPALDLYLNGQLAADNLAYGDASTVLTLPAGAAALTAYDAGEPSVVFQDALTLEADSAILLAAGDPGRVAVVADELGALDFGRTRILIYNAYADGIVLGASPASEQPPIGEAIALNSAIGPFEVAAGRLDFAFVPSSAAANRTVLEVSLGLTAGASNVLIIHSDGDEPQLLVASAPADAADTAGAVAFVHAVQGAAPVDIRIDDQLIVPGLSFAEASPHIALPAGERRVSVSLGATVLALMNVEIRPRKMQTVALLGSTGSFGVTAFEDNPRDLDETSATVRLINGVPGASVGRLQLESGAIIAVDLAFGAAAESVSIAPDRQTLSLLLNIGDESGLISTPAHRFNGGAFYNLIALSGGTFSAPRLMISESSLERRISASMAGDSDMSDPDTAAPMHTIENTELADAAAAETVATAEQNQPADEAQASQPELSSEAEQAPADGLSPFLGLSPHALVDLAPDANLQLRQYPTSLALSLGLLPGGSDLMVLGRRGPSVYETGELADEPVDMSDVTEDPAIGLGRFEDLRPAETWLYIMYETPDGGALYGWVNSYYLQVFDAAGAAQRLRNLTLVRQNHAGSSLNTALRPPELSDHVSARVFGLDPTAYLNIRAANNANSEVLGHLPSDARLELVGLDAAEAWALVEYEAAQTITRGWVSADYLQLLLNDKPTTIAALRALDASIAPTVSDLARGGVRVVDPDAATPLPPPGDMMERIVAEIALDPGSMLHLRRHPNAASESLALISAGSKMPIDGRIENGEWLRTSFQQQDGWIAARYVSLLLRGRVYPRDYVLSLLDVYDSFGQSVVARVGA